MTILSVTARGQVIFPKNVLEHLGIQPGGKMTLDLLPDGRAELRAGHSGGSWRELHGMLKDKDNITRFTIEEINEAIVQAAAAAAPPRAGWEEAAKAIAATDDGSPAWPLFANKGDRKP